MPFRGMSAMDQKREFVVFAAAEGANVRPLCRRFGISPTTGYKWLERYRREGLAGLAEQSRRPRLSPCRTPPASKRKWSRFASAATMSGAAERSGARSRIAERIEYAPGDLVRKVDGDGFISFKNRPRRISKALRGEPIALRPTNEDGVFAAHYCAHRIGDIDLKKGDDEACGLLDNAARCPQGPQAQQQQQTPLP